MQAAGCLASVGALAAWDWPSSMEGGGDAPTKRLVSLALVIAAIRRGEARGAAGFGGGEGRMGPYRDDFDDATDPATAAATGKSGWKLRLPMHRSTRRESLTELHQHIDGEHRPPRCHARSRPDWVDPSSSRRRR